MLKYDRQILLLFASILMRYGAAAGAIEPAGTVAEGTRFATPYYVIVAKEPGPKVLIVGGVHGDETAGAKAAEGILAWTPRCGTLVVLPRANVPALKAKKRNIPDEPATTANLNRNFPRAGKDEPPRGTPAAEIWQLVKELKPDWLIDLHEGGDFNQINNKSVGSTLLASNRPAVDKAAPLMREAVNEGISDPQHKFVIRRQPIDSSLARAAAEHLKINGMILETTNKGQPLARRVEQHHTMVRRLLEHLAMLDPKTPDPAGATRQPRSPPPPAAATR